MGSSSVVYNYFMQVILTHEQADFDALGAMLGAALLFPGARPVLPHKTNRNVRSFLNLYLPDLPFGESADLPGEKIDQVILVDTQSLVTVKGLVKNPKIRVFDHHEVRLDLPGDWELVLEKTGASTTILLERLIDQDISLSAIQSTLMLLGVYEDTGSLTYAGTIPRDVRAVAYLLEHGANLQLASNFLNPPLSTGQRKLYEDLLEKSESYVIKGHSIVIAAAKAGNLQDEISTIAHKLRDFLDPEGLFLVVQTSDGIRIVARSTSDHVNVAKILGHFNGGGHERAASALIQEKLGELKTEIHLDSVKTKILEQITESIQPAITARQIMSSKPNVIQSDTPASSAILKMQRLGYEGFPVVKNKKVIGLLTRRAVDRAQIHKLNLPASSLMEAGTISVVPEDPLDIVQQKMSESGWGQIPVVAADTGEVLGIITRTDILRQIAPKNHTLPERKNFSAQLKEALSPARYALLKAVAKKASELEMPIFIVGGFVRDLILKKPGSDFDIVVEGDAISLARVLSSEFTGNVVSHGRFGTAKWLIEPSRESIIGKLMGSEKIQSGDLPDSLDLISARTEFYDHPTALPTIEKGSIKLDLHRRDFTINTLAIRLDEPHHGELYDYWGGVNDLQNGLIRVLHALSFVDDPTRILRAIRFEQRFHFSIELRTLELLYSSRELLDQLSGSRVRHEFDLIMLEKQPEAVLSRAQELELFGRISEELCWKEEWKTSLRAIWDGPLSPIWKLPDHFGSLPIKTILAYLTWLGHFPAEVAAKIANHLRFSAQFVAALKTVSRVRDETGNFPKYPPSVISSRLQAVSPVGIAALYYLADNDEIKDLILKYQSTWKNLKIFTDGKTLQKLGLPVGPKYRKILQALRDAWLDGEISSKVEESNLLMRLLG